MRTTTVLLAAAVLGLTGCSTGGKPTPSVTVTKTAAPAKATDTEAADPWEACVQAVADSKGGDTYPSECQDLSTDDYYRAVSEANRRNIAKARREIDQASESAAAQP